MDIDKKLLLDIFTIPSMSGHEHLMAEFIKKRLSDLNIEFEEDSYGNIFKLEGEKPFLNAHMDTVQDIDDCFLVDHISIKEGTVLDGLGVIGGDDKCGIYIILRLLEKGFDINFAFTVEEEIGTIGARHLVVKEEERLKECLYGLTLDRRGNGDIICYKNSYGTLEFESNLEEIGASFGYKATMGVLSDADEFRKTMSCANLSVGYYGAHTKKEYVILSDLANAEEFVIDILTNMKAKYEIPEDIYSYGYGYGHKYYKNGYESYIDEYDNYYNNYNDINKNKEKNGSLWEDEEIGEYYDISCCSCGSKSNVRFMETLRNYYCRSCLTDIGDEIFSTIGF